MVYLVNLHLPGTPAENHEVLRYFLGRAVGALQTNALADAAVVSLTLHHLSDPARALSEVRRVVAPGGRLIVVDFLKHSAELMRERYGDRWLGFDPAELGGWLERAGFALVGTRQHDIKLGLRLGLFEARRPETEENT